MVLVPHRRIGHALQSDHNASRFDEVADKLDRLQRHGFDIGQDQDSITQVANPDGAIGNLRAVLQDVVIEQVEVVTVGDQEPAQRTPLERARPFARIADIESPLIGQGGIDGNVGGEIALLQKIATTGHIIAQQRVVLPPYILVADPGRGIEGPRRCGRALRCGGVADVKKEVGPGTQEDIAGDLEFLQRGPVRLPVEVGMGLDTDDVASIKMRARSHVFLRTDPGVEPRHGVLLPGGDLHLGDVGRSGSLDVVGREAIRLNAALDTVAAAPVEKRFEEGFEPDSMEKLVHVVAYLGGELADVKPDRGQESS